MAPALCASNAPWPRLSCLEAWGLVHTPRRAPSAAQMPREAQRRPLKGSPRTRASLFLTSGKLLADSMALLFQPTDKLLSYSNEGFPWSIHREAAA